MLLAKPRGSIIVLWRLPRAIPIPLTGVTVSRVDHPHTLPQHFQLARIPSSSHADRAFSALIHCLIIKETKTTLQFARALSPFIMSLLRSLLEDAAGAAVLGLH